MLQLVERCLGLIHADRKLTSPLHRGRNIVVIVTEICAVARRFELDRERVYPFLRRDRLLLRHLAGMEQVLIRSLGHIAIAPQGVAAPLDSKCLGFLCLRCGETGSRLFDPKLDLTNPSNSIRIRLRHRLGTRALKIDKPAGGRLTLAFGRADLDLQL